MKTLQALAALLVCSVAVTVFAQDQNAATRMPETINVRVLRDDKSRWIEPSTLVGVLGVLGGIAGVLIQRFWHRRDEELSAQRADRSRLESYVLDSLRWFEGKTQKRSIGIAVIEGNWDRFADLHETWLAVLTNQAVYLLASSEQEDAAHERSNLNRIIALISRGGATISIDQRTSLAEAIEENRRGHGLRGISAEKLNEWSRTFTVSN